MKLPSCTAGLLVAACWIATAPAEATDDAAKPQSPASHASAPQKLTEEVGDPESSSPQQVGDPIVPDQKPAQFGAAISKKTPMQLADLLKAPEKNNGKVVVVEGLVAEVCQNKGCWMTLQVEDKEMRVRFKDYAFFVPKDSAGKTARVEGVFEYKDVPVEEARHYLEDAGKKDEAAKIDAPVKSYTFMASGVELR